MVHREEVTPEKLNVKLASMRGSRDPIYIYFTASMDATGSRWCPDCSSADPVLEEAFQCLVASATILEVPVSRESWKGPEGPNHPLRQPPYGVRGVPTLALWDALDEKVRKRFTEHECEQLEQLQATMMSHV